MQKKRDRVLFFMAIPAFAGFLIFFIAPVIMSFAYSFTNWSVYRPGISFVGLDQFMKIFKDPNAMLAIKNTLIYALLITVVQNALAILTAVFLHRKLFMASVLKAVFFLPAVLAILVVGYLFRSIMTSGDSGLFNTIIRCFGGSNVNWLGDRNLALYSVLITQVWQWTGWSMVIYIANLKSIDITLYEAARIDGAGPLQTFFRITLPLLYPAASFNILMSLIGGLKVFDAVFAMTKGGPGHASSTIMTTMIDAFKNGYSAYFCAFAMVFFIVVFTISRIVTYVLSRWEAKVS